MSNTEKASRNSVLMHLQLDLIQCSKSCRSELDSCVDTLDVGWLLVSEMIDDLLEYGHAVR